MIALSSGVTLAWWLTLAVGLVVLLVVAGLLELLRRSVHLVRQRVDDVLSMGGRVAQNTWTIQLLLTIRSGVRRLVEQLTSPDPAKE